MKKLILFLFVVSFWSCKEDNADLELTFKLTYDGEPFTFFQELTYPDGTPYSISNISTYISNITLKNSTGESELISEVEFLDLGKTHQNLEGANNGYALIFGDISIQNISELEFNIGVTPEQNMTVPSDYSSSSPLSRSGEYWSGWNSYIMTKFEGFYDTESSSPLGYTLHLGSDSAFRSISITDIKSDEEIIIEIDVSKIFSGSNGNFDLASNLSLHSLEKMDEINELADNFSSALRLLD